MALSMLTTVDNPFDPFLQYDAWYQYDTVVLGYNTSSFLARILVTSLELSEEDQDIAIETAIDEVVKENVLGVYRRVSQETNII